MANPKTANAINPIEFTDLNPIQVGNITANTLNAPLPTPVLPTLSNFDKFKINAGSAISSTAKSDPGAFGQIAEGLGGIASGLIGGRARRREQRAARAELARQRQAYENFEFKDPSANLTNPFEDLRVGTQAADFTAQQQQQALAGTLSGLQQAAGGSGIGALAQALAQQQSANLAASAANIQQQELANQAARAQGQAALEQQQAAGAAALEAKEFGRTETLFGMAQARNAAADEARRRATQGLVGGIANVAVGAGRVAAGGI